MRRLGFALVVLFGLAGPAAAQDPSGFYTVVIQRPFVQVAEPPDWPGVAEALRRGDGMWRLFEEQGFELTPWTIYAASLDLIAGGERELMVSFREGCGNSGCWTYLLEWRDGRWEMITNTVLADTFVLWRNPGDTYSAISGYRHGLFWNGRRWVQFCTDNRYCG